MSNAPAGWYDDGTGRQRWWDGNTWTQHYAPAAAVAQANPPHVPEMMTLDQRRARLAESIARSVANGWRVESQSDTVAVVANGGRPNHILHLILTLVTFGLWAIVWIIVGLTTKEYRQTLIVDEYGHVHMT